jgi:hypothetical protein
MSNSAFHHSDPKVEEAMTLVIGVLHKHGCVTGRNQLKECVKKLRQCIYTPKRLGSTPAEQYAIIEKALRVLVDRRLASFNRSTKTLSITKRGRHEREQLIQRKRQLAMSVH